MPAIFHLQGQGEKRGKHDLEQKIWIRACDGNGALHPDGVQRVENQRLRRHGSYRFQCRRQRERPGRKRLGAAGYFGQHNDGRSAGGGKLDDFYFWNKGGYGRRLRCDGEDAAIKSSSDVHSDQRIGNRFHNKLLRSHP